MRHRYSDRNLTENFLRMLVQLNMNNLETFFDFTEIRADDHLSVGVCCWHANLFTSDDCFNSYRSLMSSPTTTIMTLPLMLRRNWKWCERLQNWAFARHSIPNWIHICHRASTQPMFCHRKCQFSTQTIWTRRHLLWSNNWRAAMWVSTIWNYF